VGYATRGQVLSYMGRLMKTTTDTSTPALADVDGYLADTAGTIDEALASRGIATPVTAPAASVEALARLNAIGAAAHAHLAAYGADATDRGTGATLLRLFEQRITEIYAGKGLAVGLAASERVSAVSSLWTDAGATSAAPGVSPFGEPVSTQPLFRVGRPY
jgi:hypothetical protein